MHNAWTPLSFVSHVSTSCATTLWSHKQLQMRTKTREGSLYVVRPMLTSKHTITVDNTQGGATRWCAVAVLPHRPTTLRKIAAVPQQARVGQGNQQCLHCRKALFHCPWGGPSSDRSSTQGAPGAHAAGVPHMCLGDMVGDMDTDMYAHKSPSPA